MNLTDDDRAAIQRISAETAYVSDEAEACYLAGIRAGMERAAKMCEQVASFTEAACASDFILAEFARDMARGIREAMK